MSSLNKHRHYAFAVVAITASYLFFRLDRGWIAHDEGLLGQAAERVLQGQLPHLDFVDPYTGGQALLHAAVMFVAGINLLSLRYFLFGCTLLFAIIFYKLSCRLAPPLVAAAITWLAVAWSVPNYFAALPSWYNLFLATAMTWALLKFDETDQRRWLVTAGIIVGLSFLIKVAGLYMIAAGMLFLVYREIDRSSIRKESDDSAWPWKLFTTLSLAFFGLAIVMLVRQRLTLMDSFIFIIPAFSLGLLVGTNELGYGRGAFVERFLSLLSPLFTFLCSALLPIVIFLIPYFMNGGLDEFFQGVFVLPQKRFLWANYSLPSITSLVAAIPWLVILLLPFANSQWMHSWWMVVILGAIAMVVLPLAGENAVYVKIWDSMRPLIPLLTIVGCIQLYRARMVGSNDSAASRRLFLLLCVMALGGLIQYPYSSAIYFCYVAPLVILAFAAVLQMLPQPPLKLYAVAASFCFAFALIWLHHGKLQRMGVQFVQRTDDQQLQLPRARLYMSGAQANLYERVINEVQLHLGSSNTIYAAVDCPEIYFLAGMRNPTHTFYDFFDDDFQNPSQRSARIIAQCEKDAVNVVVIRWQGEFSGNFPDELAQAIVPRYSNVKHFTIKTEQGETPPIFSVAWK